MNKISSEDLGGLLFSIHHHHGKDEAIVYYEDDILRLFKLLGYPVPIWGKSLDIDSYKFTEESSS